MKKTKPNRMYIEMLTDAVRAYDRGDKKALVLVGQESYRVFGRAITVGDIWRIQDRRNRKGGKNK